MLHNSFYLFILFLQREISEVLLPITAKFCHMVGSMFSFIIPVQKFGACPPQKKNLWPKLCAKFGAILDPFPL